MAPQSIHTKLTRACVLGDDVATRGMDAPSPLSSRAASIQRARTCHSMPACLLHLCLNEQPLARIWPELVSKVVVSWWSTQAWHYCVLNPISLCPGSAHYTKQMLPSKWKNLSIICCLASWSGVLSDQFVWTERARDRERKKSSNNAWRMYLCR
jgi:hypothetical protein